VSCPSAALCFLRIRGKEFLLLKKKFKYEIGAGTIQSPSIEQDLSIIAVVGE